MHVTYGEKKMTTRGRVAVNASFKLFARVRGGYSPLPYLFPSYPELARCVESSFTWWRSVSFAAKFERCGEVTGTLDVSGGVPAVSGWSSSDFFTRVCPAPYGDPDSMKKVLPRCICIESNIANDVRTSQFSSPPLRASNH